MKSIEAEASGRTKTLDANKRPSWQKRKHGKRQRETSREVEKSERESIVSGFDFTGLRYEEAERRRAILTDIEQRLAKDGDHLAASNPHRARQFMPFAALDGFTELIKEAEAESMSREE